MQKLETITIAGKNDEFRQLGYGVTITAGIQEIRDLPGLMRAVRNDNTFSDDNDPYGEHDFGSIQWGPELVFWKIDYFNQTLDGWCDPLSPECLRVMTVMLSCEY